MLERLPGTTDRVSTSTAPEVNEEIRRRTAERLEYYAERPDEIDDRLAELDAEWDVERTLQANASMLTLVTLALGVKVDRSFLVVPAVVATFLLQHAVQGWCPPLPVLRRLGVRTRREIDAERSALRSLRDSA